MEKCPTCTSTHPGFHPAVQHGGEVEICPDKFHLKQTQLNHPDYIAAVRKKRALLNL